MTSMEKAAGRRSRWTVRKILVAATIACLAGVLVFGAVQRTISVSSGSATHQGSGATVTGGQHQGQGRGAGGH
jgi:hypothetical protein